MWISRQVTRRIRDQHRHLAERLDHLDRAAELAGVTELSSVAAALRGELTEHLGLVEAVLEAVTEDDVVAAADP